MKIGVSTACFYPEYTEKALDILLDLGFKNFEIFVNTFSEIEKPFISELKKKLDDNDAKLVSLHPFSCVIEPLIFFSDYQRRFTDALEQYKKYFEATAFLGGENFIFHGQVTRHPAHTISDHQYYEKYHKIYEVARSFGIYLCQENVRNCRNGKTEFIKNMHEYLKDDVAFTFDIKQANIEEQDPIEMMKAMGDKIRQVHISDRKKDKACLLPGDGERDFDCIINELKKLNYNGTLTIEVYSDCFSDKNQFLKAKKLLKNGIK